MLKLSHCAQSHQKWTNKPDLQEIKQMGLSTGGVIWNQSLMFRMFELLYENLQVYHYSGPSNYFIPFTSNNCQNKD